MKAKIIPFQLQGNTILQLQGDTAYISWEGEKEIQLDLFLDSIQVSPVPIPYRLRIKETRRKAAIRKRGFARARRLERLHENVVAFPE